MAVEFDVEIFFAEELNQPITINSLYNRISEVAQWSIYGEPHATAINSSKTTADPPVANVNGYNEAEDLHGALNDWVAATNARDINRLATFYMPALKAYYLSRNVARSFVRRDKLNAFEKADVIDVQIEEPEILLNSSNRTAVMRFRKRYVTEAPSQRRSGEVIQELRWQKTGDGWKITSERDIRVIR